MNLLRNIFLYTLLLFAAGVSGGIVMEIVGRFVKLGHEWGVLDAAALIGLAIVFAIDFCVFCVLAKRHSEEYYTIGAGVVILNSISSTACAYYLAPLDARDGHNWIALAVGPLIVTTIALASAGQILRLRRSSSNIPLERTRD